MQSRTSGRRAGAADDTPPTALEEKQALLAHMVRLVARRASNGLFVYGTGGVGKSRVVTETLAAEGVAPVLINSHVTPLALYLTLHRHRTGQVLFLDDCDGIYGNLQILGLLRSALWGQGDRVVTYTSTQLEGAPAQFTFDSRLIFCANTIPARNEAFKAVLSRVDVFELAASNEEVVEQMAALAARGYKSLPPETCGRVVEFIRQAGGSRQLSMRLYEPSLEKVRYALENGIDWRELVRSQLDQLGRKDHLPSPVDSRKLNLAWMERAIAAHPTSVRDQEEFWCKGTRKSRAQFFRVKKEFLAQRGGQSD